MICRELSSYARLKLDVVAAEGDELVLRDGRRVLDLYGGHCVNTLGAGDSALGQALSRQWKLLSFATNLLALEEREVFFEAFGKTLPAPVSGSGSWRVFLSNSGAEANENALKGALSATGRKRVVCFEGAFHGRTAAATAVTDTSDSGFVRPPFDVCRIPFGDIEAASHTVGEDTAAVIIEPIQAMAGVVEAGFSYLATLRSLCSDTATLLVYDEVQTGNGRLGTPFASQKFGVVPDIFTTAKGAAGGLPIGLTVFSDAVAEAFDGKLFGSTFGGGPLVLTAATEVSRRIASGELLANVVAVSEAFQKCGGVGPVQAVRGEGLLLGLEIAPGTSARDVQAGLLAQGILVGNSADSQVVRLSPPLTLAPERAETLRQALQNLEVVV
jgi:acetylornithine/succinyldiaminopimelate/putrescine aminotransferase